MRYGYNGDGVRVRTTAGQGPLQMHVYHVNASLPVLLNDGNRRYIYGAEGSPLYAVEGNCALEVYHRDGLGSVRAVTKRHTTSGKIIIVQTYGTEEFGVPDPALTQGTSNQPFQFASEERDKETGARD